MSMKKENKNLKRGKRQQINKKRNSNEPRVLEFNLSKSILVLLIIGMIIGVITTARIIITINEGKQSNALATEEGKNSERVNWVTSSDGIQVPVPKGYVASQIPGETSVNGGFVIYEDTAEGIDWNTILGTAASTLSLDEEVDKTETKNKNEEINNMEEANKSEELNKVEETDTEDKNNTNKEQNVEEKLNTENETEEKVEQINKIEETNKVNEIEKTDNKTESTTNTTTEETNTENLKTDGLETKEKVKETEDLDKISQKTEETQKVEEKTKETEEIKETEKKDKTMQETIEKENTERTTEETKTESTKETQEEIKTNNLDTEKTTNEEVKIPEEKVIAKEQITNVKEETAGTELQAENAGIEAMAEDTALNIYNLQRSTNQYIWVPVNDISRICGIDSNGKLWGKLYNVGDTGRSNVNWTETDGLISITDKFYNYREPDVTHYDTDYDIDSKLQNYLYGETQYELLAEELEKYFCKTIESIKKYGGFYIGRYETGGLNGTAVVRKMDINIASQTWYTMYKRCKELKGENGNVITSMIWGNLWDETLQWLVESGATNSKGEVLGYSRVGSDSTSWGNYSNSTFSYIPAGSTTGEATETKASAGKYDGIIIPTGSSEYTKANNIYDLAGNVCDWTLEASINTGCRVCRGGDCNDYGGDDPADYRGIGYPSISYLNNGCRALLLIE